MLIACRRAASPVDDRERPHDPGASLRDRHVAAVERMVPDYVARIDWAPARLQTERTVALRALLTTAVERSSWHRGRLGGVDTTSLSDHDIVDLPVMTKTDLMDDFDAIVTDPRLSRRVCEAHLDHNPGDHLLGEFQVVASGGSSGTRGVFAYGWDAWSTCYASNVRFQVRDWSRDPTLAGTPRVIAVVAASSPTHISAALSKTFSSGDDARHLFPVSLPIDTIVAGLNELQPTVLMGYSSFLPRLALEARNGRLHIAPRRVIAISEPLLPEARRVIDETWAAPIANGYAMSEGIFTGCCGHGIHLPDDLCIFEPVDAEGQPVGPGVLSHRVLITNLYNHTQPLIRYEVTDQVTLVDGPCPCGSSFRRIEDPQGRLDDTFQYAEGPSVHPHLFRSALGQLPAVIEYQVRQTRHGATIRIVTTAPVDRGALEARITDALAALGLRDPRVTIEIVDALPRQASGKLKRFEALSS
jgi:phenylacetate-coenzyme A ligase PaaK-like adenylate-forming protein